MQKIISIKLIDFQFESELATNPIQATEALTNPKVFRAVFLNEDILPNLYILIYMGVQTAINQVLQNRN